MAERSEGEEGAHGARGAIMATSEALSAFREHPRAALSTALRGSRPRRCEGAVAAGHLVTLCLAVEAAGAFFAEPRAPGGEGPRDAGLPVAVARAAIADLTRGALR